MATGYSNSVNQRADGVTPDLEWWSLSEIKEEFGWNAHRAWLIEGFVKASAELRRHGGSAVVLGGSFIDKNIEFPGDYDACFITVGLLPTVDDALYLPEKEQQRKDEYRGDWLPARIDPGPAGKWLRFLATDRNGNPRKLIALKLRLNELDPND